MSYDIDGVIVVGALPKRKGISYYLPQINGLSRSGFLQNLTGQYSYVCSDNLYFVSLHGGLFTVLCT